MTDRFQACLAFTLRPENDGQACHTTAGDPGGTTAWGVTHATLCDWLGRPATLADMRALTAEDAAPIYRARYWSPIRGDDLAAGVDLMVFDYGVMSGWAASARLLQGVVCVDRDAIIGPLTLAACAKMDRNTLIERLARVQETSYRSMRNYWRFGRDWIGRLDRRQITAIGMAASAAV